MNRSPVPSVLARAVYQGLTGAPASGFSLIEVMLSLGGLALLSGAAFIIYDGAANNADVRTEQSNIQAIASNADKAHGAFGSYTGLTTSQAVADGIAPASMVSGTGLISRWSEPVLLEPVAVGARANAGLRISYQSVPARACLKFAQAGSIGMFDLEVGGASVFRHGASGQPLTLDTEAALSRCANGAPMVFTYHGGASGLAAGVLPPVSLPPVNPPSSPPPVAPPPSPPPVAPPPAPPAPGCGAAPLGAATGSTPAGQTCSFIWNSMAAPTCWAPMALCTPIAAPPPAAPPPGSPPSSPPPSTPPPSGPTCSAPSPLPETESGTAACPVGQSTPAGASTFAQSRDRTTTYACPDPFDAPVGTTSSWTAWSPDASSMCSPICVAPPSGVSTQPGAMDSQAGTPDTAAGTPGTQMLACPPAQAGSITQIRSTTITRDTVQTRTTTQSRTETYACPAPTGAYTTTYGAWSAPSAPYGVWSAPTPAGSWSAPGAPYGAWTTTSNTCALIPPSYGGTEITQCRKSFKLGQPPAAFRILGLFEAGSDNPAAYSVSWAGIPVGTLGTSITARPWTNPSPNQLAVDVQCTGDQTWGYRATATNISTGQVFTSNFFCDCINLGL